MANDTSRRIVFGFRCCGQAETKHEEELALPAGLHGSSSACTPGHPSVSKADAASKTAVLGSHTTHITVRTFTDSSGGASSVGIDEQQQLAGAGSRSRQPSPSSSHSSEIWYDCAEEWQDAAAAAAAPGTLSSHQQGAEGAYAGLPADLARLIRSYQEGRSMGCKPTVALMQHMEASRTSLEQLLQQLAPLLAAEQQQQADGCELPVPTPIMDPLARTGFLTSAASQAKQQQQHQQAGRASSSSSRQPACRRASLAHLLGNVRLSHDTLAGMTRQEGFKQVAWGQLEMWYCHDTMRRCQVIRGRVVLDEPVEHAVCLAREVDLVTSWNPAITEMVELAAYSPAELLVYMLLWTPWPLYQPEVVNYAVGLDLLDTEQECVLIATKGCSGELPAGVALPQHARAQRLAMDAGGFKFRPLPPNPDRPGVPRMEATVLVSIDASRWAVPDAIISFVLKVFAPLVLKSVLKVLQRMFHSSNSGTRSSSSGASSPGSMCSSTLLMQRLAARPEYAAIGAHARRHLAAKAAAAAAQAGSSSGVQK